MATLDLSLDKRFRKKTFPAVGWNNFDYLDPNHKSAKEYKRVFGIDFLTPDTDIVKDCGPDTFTKPGGYLDFTFGPTWRTLYDPVFIAASSMGQLTTHSCWPSVLKCTLIS